MGNVWVAPSPVVAKIAARLARVLAAPMAAYEPFWVEDHRVGWITPQRVQRLTRWANVFRRSGRGVELTPALDTPPGRTAALADVARTLSAEGALTAWRDERYPVAADARSPALFELERAAARYFGIRTFAAHATGLVGDPGHWQMWLARRSATKPIDPGLLDNLVGGGIAAGAGVADTLVKEAWEEAGIAAELARRAERTGTVDICRDQPDGLQRETIHAHDLWLPADFLPQNQDGEAAEHRLRTPDAVLAILATDDITADASLVIVDFLLRRGHVSSGDRAFGALDALRHPPPSALQPRRP